MEKERLLQSNGQNTLDSANPSSPLRNEMYSKETECCNKKEPIVPVEKLNGSTAAVENLVRVKDDSLYYQQQKQQQLQHINSHVQDKSDAEVMKLKFKDLQLEYEENMAQSVEDRVKFKRDNDTLRLELEAASSFSKAEEIVKLRTQNEKLNVELGELQLQYENIQTEYDDLSNQLMDSLQEEETLRDKYGKLELKISALLKHSTTTDEVFSENSSVESLEIPQNSKSSRQLSESDQQLRRQVDLLTADNAQLCVENKSLLESTEQTINEMRIEITKLSTELLDKSSFVEKCDIEESKEIVATLTKTIECLHRENSQLKQQLDHAAGEKEKLLEDCVKMNNRDELVKSLEKQLATIETLSSEKQQLEKALESIKSEHEATLEVLKLNKANLSLALDQKNQEASVTNDMETAQELQETKENTPPVEELHTEHEKLENSLQKARETIKILRAEKQQLENSIESIKTKYGDALQALQLEQNNLSIALDLQRKEASNFKDREETLCLKIKTLTLQLHETNEKMLAMAQLQGENEKFVKSLVLAKQENHALSHQIKTVEAALAEAQRNAAQDKVTWKTQIYKMQTEFIAAEQARKDLLLAQQRLETQICDDQATLQKQRQEFESSLGELELKSKSLQKANVRLQSTNTNLGEQLQTVTRQVSECATLRRELERLNGEHEVLQRRLKASVAEADQCRSALKKDVSKHKELWTQSTKACNSYRTLLDTKESSFKDEKLKLENTVSCLLLEKKALEEKLYFNEAIAKKLQGEFPLRMKADRTETNSLDRNEIQQLKSHIIPIKMSSPFLERKNRRLRTHDERRSQSIRAIYRNNDTKEDENGVAEDITPNGHR